MSEMIEICHPPVTLSYLTRHLPDFSTFEKQRHEKSEMIFDSIVAHSLLSIIGRSKFEWSGRRSKNQRAAGLSSPTCSTMTEPALNFPGSLYSANSPDCPEAPVLTSRM